MRQRFGLTPKLSLVWLTDSYCNISFHFTGNVQTFVTFFYFISRFSFFWNIRIDLCVCWNTHVLHSFKKVAVATQSCMKVSLVLWKEDIPLITFVTWNSLKLKTDEISERSQTLNHNVSDVSTTEVFWNDYRSVKKIFLWGCTLLVQVCSMVCAPTKTCIIVKCVSLSRLQHLKPFFNISLFSETI